MLAASTVTGIISASSIQKEILMNSLVFGIAITAFSAFR